MVQLVASDIRTEEVLGWRGVHLLHFPGSSCSQKTRIVLNLKGVEWVSHLVDLRTQQNMDEWFLGINPRGLVPVLVHDGVVQIESNDIIRYIDRTFGGLRLVPAGREPDIARLLHDEDDLHLDLRTITMRFVFPPQMVVRPPEKLARYAAGGSGQVGGRLDERRPVEIAFWSSLAKDGISDDQGRDAVNKFKAHFARFEKVLAGQPYLMGESLTLLDIAWFVYANRLKLAGYPLEAIHPRFSKWFDGLAARPDFAREIALPEATRELIDAYRRQQIDRGSSMVQVLTRR